MNPQRCCNCSLYYTPQPRDEYGTLVWQCPYCGQGYARQGIDYEFRPDCESCSTNLQPSSTGRDYPMIDFIPSGDHGEHLIPEPEAGDHCPHDFCPCHPVYRLIHNRYFWVHNINEENALFDQAEAIRNIVSIQLWHEHLDNSKVTGQKLEVIKFPAGFTTPIMPPPAKR